MISWFNRTKENEKGVKFQRTIPGAFTKVNNQGGATYQD